MQSGYFNLKNNINKQIFNYIFIKKRMIVHEMSN